MKRSVISQRRPSVSLRLFRRLALLISASGLVFCATTAVAQTYLFDFGAAGNTTQNGPAPEDPINFWNNVTEAVGGSATGQLTNIVTTGNGASTVGLVIVNRFNASNGNGTTASSLFPSEASRDSLYGNTESFNQLSNIFPSFKLVGLDPAATYDFTFFASRTGVSDNRETGYTLAGSNNGFGALNAANNINNVVLVSGMHPTAAGEIAISMAPTANNNNGNHFTYLGVMKVVAVPPQTPLGFTLEPVNVRAVELTDVTFQAAVTGSVPHFVQWFSNGVPIDGATQFTYTIPAVRLDMDGSLFSVNVSNLAYSVTSSNALLRVINDTNSPVIVSATTLDGLHFTVCYNELLDSGSATEVLYYTITNHGVAMYASTIELSPEGKCVTITLEQPITGAFDIAVESVMDASGNAIAPGTVVSGQVPVPEHQMILVDFGAANTMDAADDPARRWNNLTTGIGQTDNGQLSPLVTTQNLTTAISITMINRFGGANENGTTSSSVYPLDATRDSLFGNTEPFNGASNIYPKFKLTGLNPSRSYTLTFFASRTGVTDVRETDYTVVGAVTAVVSLNAANNTNQTVTASNVVPSSTGEITIGLTPGANNNNGNHFTYLGVLQITPGPLGAVLLSPTILGANVNLQWAGAGELQAAPTVNGPWSPVTPTSANAHTEAVDFSTNRFFRIQLP